MENECEALPGVAYRGVRDNRSTLNTKTGYDDDDDDDDDVIITDIIMIITLTDKVKTSSTQSFGRRRFADGSASFTGPASLVAADDDNMFGLCF